MKNKILFISSTHGNENFSISVLEELEKEYPKEKYGYDWIIGNPKAVEQNVRFIDTDLNRAAPGNAKSDLYEEKRAAEIIELSKQYDIVIDIHGTKSDFGIVKIIPYPSYQNLVLAGLFQEKRNVIWYSKESKKRGPLVQFMSCPAIELECGDKRAPKTQKLLKKTLSSFLQTANKAGSVLEKTKNQEFYVVYDKALSDVDQQTDFRKVADGGIRFYPFLATNGYKDVSYYKLKKIVLEEVFELFDNSS
jgi:succinylglutamate desuccinylase